MITGLDSKTKIMPFSYVQSITLSASANNVTVLTLNDDSQFLLQAVFASSSLDLDADFMPNNFSVQIQDGGTGKFFSNARVPQRAGIGNAFLGVQEAQGVLFAPKTPVQFDVLNLQASENIVTFVLKGFKLFIGNT